MRGAAESVTASICVPAKTSFVATYTFDMTTSYAEGDLLELINHMN